MEMDLYWMHFIEYAAFTQCCPVRLHCQGALYPVSSHCCGGVCGCTMMPLFFSLLVDIREVLFGAAVDCVAVDILVPVFW